VSDDLRRRKRPTQADVARLAAVSQPVVSYVLSGDPDAPVAPGTRQRVLEAIARLGYVPHHPARSLRNRRTFTIAGVIPDITNPFYPAFVRGIQDVAEEAGYDLITYNTDGTLERERKILQSALAGRVDGVIITPFHVPLAECAALADAGVAVVALSSHVPPAGPEVIDTLSIDSVAAARTAVNYLIERGHRRIGMVAGEAGTPPREDRVLGYTEALREWGLLFDRMLVRGAGFNEAGGFNATSELLRLVERPTAIFAANDLMAMGAIAALGAAGLRVPEEMAVVGFDDIPAARLVAPPLTTIAQHPERLGARAAQLLLERLAGQGPPAGRHEAMPFDLVVRRSA
jgi:LacI family transcriptional regulator